MAACHACQGKLNNQQKMRNMYRLFTLLVEPMRATKDNSRAAFSLNKDYLKNCLIKRMTPGSCSQLKLACTSPQLLLAVNFSVQYFCTSAWMFFACVLFTTLSRLQISFRLSLLFQKIKFNQAETRRCSSVRSTSSKFLYRESKAVKIFSF